MEKRAVCAFVTVGLLGLGELTLVLVDYGAPGARADPFRGYSDHHPTFVKESRVDGVWRVRTNGFVEGMNPESFVHPKPSGVVRVFLLGGSTVAGLYLRRGQTLSRQLDRALSNQWPDVVFEVINAGREGKSSHTMPQLVEEVLGYEPDLLVLYSGHNDWPNTRWDGELIEPDMGTWLRMALDRFRLYVGLRELIQRDDSDADVPEFENVPGGVVSPEEMLTVERRFEENIGEVIERADQAKVPVVLCTLVSDPYSPPAGCDLGEDLQTPVGEACEHFLRGIQLLESDEALAREELKMAVEKDPQPLRARQGLNDVLRVLSVRHRAPLVDLAKELDGGFIASGGPSVFLDELHPSAIGIKEMAAAIRDQIIEQDVLQP